MIDVLVQSMFWCSQYFGAVNVLVPSKFCAVDVFVQSIFEFPPGMSLAGMVNVFKTVNVLTQSNFEVPVRMLNLHKPLYRKITNA